MGGLRPTEYMRQNQDSGTAAGSLSLESGLSQNPLASMQAVAQWTGPAKPADINVSPVDPSLPHTILAAVVIAGFVTLLQRVTLLGLRWSLDAGTFFDTRDGTWGTCH